MKIKKRKKPFDIIFRNTSLISDDKSLFKNINGEIRVYKGIRGYAKSTDSKLGKLSIAITPKKNQNTEIMLSTENAGIQLVYTGSTHRWKLVQNF